MGKIPTSAFLHLYGPAPAGATRGAAATAAVDAGGLATLATRVARDERDAGARADALVRALANVYRVGRKLATMYVSALSVPALAPGLTPWHPAIDGAHLVVVDTNVARVVDALRGRGARTAYDARAAFVQRVAARIDLRAFDPDVPAHAPRVVQQALYLYRSGANRGDRGDPCARAAARCDACVRVACPFEKG
jgi:hypothetical protein